MCHVVFNSALSELAPYVNVHMSLCVCVLGTILSQWTYDCTTKSQYIQTYLHKYNRNDGSFTTVCD